ncbi:MAG TPA: Gmad2 immunoglobulin-like domain-containing protein [Thermomicrobiales bacterium]|nr:Gmad2 immunoglobulin-like domain-containing protein [Thermomicrobiales bacterium]
MIGRRRMLYALVALLPLVLAGPIPTQAGSTDATPGAATPTSRPATVSVYFLRQERRGPRLGAAHREDAVQSDDLADAAVRELLLGPTPIERDAGLTTAVPADAAILGLDLDEATNLATVDLSAAFAPDGQDVEVAQLAQIVFTLTQFPHVERVAITVEGQPLALRDADGNPLPGPATRADYDHLTPLIFLESPAPGDTIASPVRLWGTANTFEATFTAEIHDAAGTLLASQVVTATSGNGVRGTFDVSLTFDPKSATSGKVVVYEISARDAARQNEVVIPVRFVADSAAEVS